MGYKYNPFTGNLDRVGPGSGSVVVESLTGDSGGAVGPDGAFNINVLGNPDIDIVGDSGTNTLQLTNLTKATSFVVDSVAGAAPYAVIQDALDAASTEFLSSGNGQVVLVRPGIYNENLTLYDGVDLYGTPAVSQNAGASVTVIGTHVPPSSGHVGFNTIYFQTTTDVFLSAVAGTTHLAFLNCESAVQSGYFLNLPNWTGILEIYDHNPNSSGAPFTVDDGGINNIGGAFIISFNAGVGFNASNPMIISGSVFAESCEFGADVTFQSSGALDIEWAQFSGTVTFAGSTSGQIQFCSFSSGAAPAITMSSSGNITLVNASIDSSNSPSIAGVGIGILNLSTITYLDNAEVADTLTITRGSLESGSAFFNKLDVVHTATENVSHALKIDCDAAGFTDIKALNIFYISGSVGPGEEEEAILVNIDESASTGGVIRSYEVLSTEEGSAIVYGYTTGINVAPILHNSGTFGNADNILNLAVDVTAALASGGAGAISIFVADNDTMTIGDIANFGQMEIILGTEASGEGVAPVFEYSTGGVGFSAFSPSDGTNGFTNTGAILWEPTDLAGWVVNATGFFEIRITRTRNALARTPIIDELQIVSSTQFIWDKDGDVNLNSLALATPLAVPEGGSGRASHTAFAVLCGGTTSTAAQQSIAGVGTAAQVLTSNGAGALPTFQDAGGGGAAAWEFVSTTVASGDSSIDFTNLTEAKVYKVIVDGLNLVTDNREFRLLVSNNNGVSFATVDYQFDTSTGGIEVDATFIGLSGTNGIGNATGEFAFCADVQIYNMNVASEPVQVTWNSGGQNQVGTVLYTSGFGLSADNSNGGSTDEIDAIRFIAESGNIASGNFHLYKLVTA